MENEIELSEEAKENLKNAKILIPEIDWLMVDPEIEKLED